MLVNVKRLMTSLFLFSIHISNVGSNNLDLKNHVHLAILPMFESSNDYRQNVLNKIITHYKPPCNSDDISKVKPDYVIRKTETTKFRT